MKFTLYCIGKTDSACIQKGIDDYCKRISHFIPFEYKMLPDVKNSAKLPEAVLKQREAELLLKAIPDKDSVILLDEKGKEYKSREFAGQVETFLQVGNRNVAFVIGGAFGFDDSMYTRANQKISLSKMTFTHQMIRLIFTEQFYRAMTIIRGMKYHND